MGAYLQSSTVLPNAKYWKKKRAYVFNPRVVKGISKTTLAFNSQAILFGDKPSSIQVNRGGFILGGTGTTALNFGVAADQIVVDGGSLLLNDGTTVLMGAGNDSILVNASALARAGLLVVASYVGKPGASLDLGLGNDRLDVVASSSSRAISVDGTLLTSDGDDWVSGEASYKRDQGAGIWDVSTGIFLYDQQSVLDTGSGADTITGLGTRGFMIGINALLSTGEGDDLIQGDTITMYSGRISTGPGNDRIDAPLQTTLTSGGLLPRIEMGDGEDRLRVVSRTYTITAVDGGFRVFDAGTSGSSLDVLLYGVEWINGPDGHGWLPLEAGTVSL